MMTIYGSMSTADIDDLLKKTATVAADGKFEPFKKPPNFGDC